MTILIRRTKELMEPLFQLTQHNIGYASSSREANREMSLFCVALNLANDLVSLPHQTSQAVYLGLLIRTKIIYTTAFVT